MFSSDVTRFVYSGMLKMLSYLNILLALAYFFGYLLNSYSWPIAALLLVIVYNGLTLRSIEQEKSFSKLQHVLALFNLVFAAFLLVWVFNILSASIEHRYFGDTRIYLVLATVFALSLVSHVLLSLRSR